MKKLLVVLLAVVLVFGFAATAMAADTLSTSYPDISAKDQTVKDAFMKLSALDVFGGYPDGTIRPDANITRAEFAKIACVVSGMAESADILKGSASKYSDVAANQWYTGWINLATSQNFIKGYPDGTYKPNNNISMQEALTVLLRIAGYNDNLVGPWPLNYIAQGGKLGVTDDVAFAGAAAATRASVAVMASNLLDINVVYWDADKTKFVEDTKKVDGDDVAITVLEDKFGAATATDVTISGWEFADFDDQELDLIYDEDSSEMASKYWISDGQVINSLGNMQANLIMNGDKEVVYVDVTSTNLYSDDVTVNDDGTVEVNGKTVKLTADADVPSADDYTAKVYYNEDGKVYLVAECTFGFDSPAVFETYNASKNRIETYNLGNIKTDVDLAILKAGQFITTADLKDGDLLNKITVSGADAAYVVTSFKTGELTKGNATKLTIGGTALVYANAKYSADAMDTFANITEPGDVDDAYGTTVKYASTLVNPYDLRLMVFEGGESTTLYGIVTDVKANIDGLVSAITVLGADGKEVEYKIVKGDNSRPDYESYSDIYYSTYGWDLTFGSYIQAKVSEDGTIDTDDIVVLVDPIYYGYEDNNNWYYDLEYYSGNYEYDYATININNNRIQLDGVYYTMNKDTLVFQTTTDDGFDKAEVIDVADLMAADSITEGYVLAFVKDGVAKQIYLLDTDLTSTSAFGVIDSFSYYSGDWHVALLGGAEYTIASSNYSEYSAYVDKVFVSYSLSGDKLTAATPAVLYTEWCDEYDDIHVYLDAEDIDGRYYYGDREFVWSEYDYYDEDLDRDVFDVAVNGSIIMINGQNYTVTDDTVFYFIDGIDITEGDIYDINDNGQNAVVCLTTDDPSDYILEYVFICEYELCSVYYGYGWPVID